MISRLHMMTDASKSNPFGSWVLWDWVSSFNSTCFFVNIIMSERDTPIQEYLVGTWHSNPKIPCRNVTLRSKNIVSERDTPIQEYHVGTWHSDPIISLFYHLVSPLFPSLTIFHLAFFIQGITSIQMVNDNTFHGLGISDQSQNTRPRYTITQSST